MRRSSPRPPSAGTSGSSGAGTSDDDVRLIRGAQAGAADAMNELLRKYWAGVVEYVARYVEHYDAAEDIAQELFLRLWQKKLTWKRQGSLRSFLYGVARNLARNQGRRWRELRLASLETLDTHVAETTAHGPSETFVERELETRYEQAVSALPARRQEIFILARVHGLSYQEIAEVMRISPQTVANQMSAALAYLRRALQPVLDG